MQAEAEPLGSAMGSYLAECLPPHPQPVIVGSGLLRQAWQALAPLVLQLAVATTTVVRNASYSPSTRLHREDRSRERPSGSRCRHALEVNRINKNTKETRNSA
eukprot:625801-Pleurochrysis_carterae.AAC.1